MYQYLGQPPTLIVTDTEYAAILAGLAYFPDGMIVQDQSTNAVAIIAAGQKHSLFNEVLGYLQSPTAMPIPIPSTGHPRWPSILS